MMNRLCGKIMQTVFIKKTLTKTQAKVFNRKIWVPINKTTDVDGRYVVVCVLDSEIPGKVMLVGCKHHEKINSITIPQLFDRMINILMQFWSLTTELYL